MPHTEQYHTVRCTLTKRHGSPKSAQCMAKVDQIGFGGAGGDGDGGEWEALAGTARMSGEGGGGISSREDDRPTQFTNCDL